MRLAIFALLLAAMPATAGELPVPTGKGWQHAATGLILRSTILGLPRTRLTDAATGEWDVSAQYNDPDQATVLTVFVFHPGGGDAAMWFDLARTQIEQRPVYGGATPLSPPVAFAPQGTSVASALRQSFATGKKPYRSTGLAVVPIQDWVVAIRLSSTSLDMAALDARLVEAVTAIGWPRPSRSARVALPIMACPTTLSCTKAKQKKLDLMQALLAGTMTQVIAEKKLDKPTSDTGPLCRDGDATTEYAAYRSPGVTNAYVLALGASGRTVDVYRSFDAPGLPSGYAVTLHDLDGSFASFPYFESLPRPDQVLMAVQRGVPTSRRAPAGNRSRSTRES